MYIKWADFKSNLNKNNTIECALQLEINNEKQWRIHEGGGVSGPDPPPWDHILSNFMLLLGMLAKLKHKVINKNS